nr:MAG TPA: hypothetical protein [Caudoviricetes sp.]
MVQVQLPLQSNGGAVTLPPGDEKKETFPVRKKRGTERWQTRCMRRTENPVKVIRFHLFPQNLYGVVQFPQVR